MRIRSALVAALVLAAPHGAGAVPPPVAAPAPGIAGSWGGGFIGANFIFEFTAAGAGWTGRYRSDKSNKWAPLQNVTVAGDTLRFSFESQPPSTFTLRLDAAGRTMAGSATFGPHAAIPLTLKRIA